MNIELQPVPEFNSEIHFEHSQEFKREMFRKLLLRIQWLIELFKQEFPHCTDEVELIKQNTNRLLGK